MTSPYLLFKQEEPKIPETEKEIAQDYVQTWAGRALSDEEIQWSLYGRKLIFEGVTTNGWKFKTNSREVQLEEIRRIENVIRSKTFGDDITIRSRIVGQLLSRILAECPEEGDTVVVNTTR